MQTLHLLSKVRVKLVSLDNGPSQHLTWKELACKDGTPYPEQFKLDGRIFKLAQVFEDIRAIWGLPIIIDSAYRSPAHNKKIGGARNSQHVQGRALDLQPPKGITIGQFYITIKNHVDEFGIRGLGEYVTFVHVDIRPTDKLVAWSGSGTKDSGNNA
jgi:uncharacterized protein YcbK (DUF882 family)